jgi:hypothetical protein
MLIDRSRLATYASHAIFTHEVYEITFCHDYKIVNAILVYTMQTITMSGVPLHLNVVNKPSSIFEDVTEIRINSRPCQGNNMTHERHKGKQVATICYDYQRVGPGPTSR